MKIDKKIKSLGSNWKFDENVAKNFDNHILSSVPFYDISHKLTLKLSDFFLQDNSTCYDLGCSTGKLLKNIANRHHKKHINFIGIDESKAMIRQAKKKKSNISFKCVNLNNFKFKKSDLIISLYSLQFVRPKYRQILVNKIYKSLHWGGAFILFEKIRGNDARFQDILNFSYFDFKRDQGLDPTEILNKELSLRSVLEPYTIAANLEFLKRAGFKDIMPIAQYLCFKGFLVIK